MTTIGIHSLISGSRDTADVVTNAKRMAYFTIQQQYPGAGEQWTRERHCDQVCSYDSCEGVGEVETPHRHLFVYADSEGLSYSESTGWEYS